VSSKHFSPFPRLFPKEVTKGDLILNSEHCRTINKLGRKWFEADNFCEKTPEVYIPGVIVVPIFSRRTI
jgi:hypothetical protein